MRCILGKKRRVCSRHLKRHWHPDPNLNQELQLEIKVCTDVLHDPRLLVSQLGMNTIFRRLQPRRLSKRLGLAVPEGSATPLNSRDISRRQRQRWQMETGL